MDYESAERDVNASGSQGAYVRRIPRGDLGDVGRNRGGLEALLSTNDSLLTDDVISGGMSEEQFKYHFKEFIMKFQPRDNNTDDGDLNRNRGNNRRAPRVVPTPNTSSRRGRRRRQENDEIEAEFDHDLDFAVTGRGGIANSHGMMNPSVVGFYIQKLRQTVEGGYYSGGGGTFPIDLHHLGQFESSLQVCVIHTPTDSIVFMDEVLAEILVTEFPALGDSLLAYRVCLHNHPSVGCMRDLNPCDIETLVAVRGVVIRASHVIPDMQTAIFRCTARLERNQASYVCGFECSRQLENGEVQEPIQCDKCHTKFSFSLCHGQSVFGNKQLLKIQETPDSIPEGETPQTVMAYAYDELVDVAKPGDRVEITGIFKASGVRVLSKQRNLKSVYRTYLDANHIQKDASARLLIGEDELEGTADTAHSLYPPETVEALKSLGRDPSIYERLTQSLAPNIWEAEDIKKGLLCQLFSGVAKQMGGKYARSDIHVLLCGDPSTAKSQLLQYVYKIAPRGVYTCGRGSSAVGLTASVTRDPESREFVLESGAIVLSDRGVCCIDEFDKMDDGARTILHEVMEQQTVSIAKAGIVCSLNARCSILASANPVNSRYDTRKTVVDNINMPPALLSRFDLIYLMLDKATEHVDRQLARHICSLYAENRTQTNPCNGLIDKETFAKYVSFARRTCTPRLSDEASQLLTQKYIEFRRKNDDGMGRSLSATPRQLESLIRISESLARMELSTIVTATHVNEAARLIQVATYTSLVDPTTGRIDFDQFNEGVSESTRLRREAIEKAICEILNNEAAGLDRDGLQKKIEEHFRQPEGQDSFPNASLSKDLEVCVRDLEAIGVLGRSHSGRFISYAGR